MYRKGDDKGTAGAAPQGTAPSLIDIRLSYLSLPSGILQVMQQQNLLHI
jgi:hypothetical protein